ncbi:hypothetical protein BJ944DRAFT_79 [Cunninghamella echinulata]|nr:hypothetical protein BJ944DRAFT_79 [Cunninghamella echinulata]
MNEVSTDATLTLQKGISNDMDNSTNEALNSDKGIIQVTENIKEQQHPILSKLNQIEQVQPLLKENTRSLFNFEGLFDIGASGIKVLSGVDNSNTPKSSSVSFKSSSENSSMINLRSTSLAEILLLLQKHISKNMSKINEEQKRLLNRIKYVDNLGLKSSQIVSITLNQSKLVSERLNEAKQVKEHAKKTRQYATSIFESLQKLEQFLDPEDRVKHPEFTKKWPALNSLYERASNQHIQPALLTRTNSSFNQKSTIATTKTTTTSTSTTNTISFEESTTLSTLPTTSSTSISTSSSALLSASESLSASVHSDPLNNNNHQPDIQSNQTESSFSSSIVMDKLRSLVGTKKD